MATRKGKRRNSEKRKEKSRDAARCRRNKESEVFAELADQLPLPASQMASQDKASLMRLAISHLKLRQLLGHELEDSYDKNSIIKKLDKQYAKALDGFVLVIAKEGDMMYLSEDVSQHLGLTQLDLIGHSIYDFTHPCDHDEIREILERSNHNSDNETDPERDFLIRMKCTLTNKGRNVNLKSAMHKVIRCSGRYVTGGSGSRLMGLHDNKSLSCLLLIGQPIPHPSNIEVPLDSHTFVTRHGMDMRFTYCDERINDLLGYENQEVVGRSVYNYHHALDAETIKDSYKNLYAKGQAVVNRYRFLAAGGGYCWVQTEATVITNQKTEKPQCVVCVNYVLSGLEDEDVIMSGVQIPSMQSTATKPASVSPQPSGIILSTESVFAPRPKDADKDMLCVTNSDGNDCMLQDLTQLAPHAGNVMTSLSYLDKEGQNGSYMETVPLVDSFGPDEQCKMCSEDDSFPFSAPGVTDMSVLNLSFLRQNKKDTNNVVPTADSSLTSPSCLYENDQTNLDLSSETLLNEGFDDVDFDLRAPYIPMDGSADQLFDPSWVPLLNENMENSQMIGITESIFTPKPPEPEKTVKNIPMSILRLLAASKQIDSSVGDIARNAGPPKMKRPMETNSLETGPPVQKMVRLEGGEQSAGSSCTLSAISCPTSVSFGPTSASSGPTSASSCPTSASSCTPPSTVSSDKDTSGVCYRDVTSFFKENPNQSNSVLKNLLTCGEDVNFGYKIKTTTTRPINQAAEVLLSSSDEDDSDDDVVMVGETWADSRPAKNSPHMVAPVSTPLTTPPGVNHPNVVVIRANNTVYVGPLAGDAGKLPPKIIGLKCM